MLRARNFPVRPASPPAEGDRRAGAGRRSEAVLDRGAHLNLQPATTGTPATDPRSHASRRRSAQFVRQGDETLGESDCAICLAELQEGAELAMPRRCGHVFHAECLAEWCKTKGALAASCPLCKRMISDEEEEKRLAAAAAATPTASTTTSSRTDESTDESSPPVGVEPRRPSTAARIATATTARAASRRRGRGSSGRRRAASSRGP